FFQAEDGIRDRNVTGVQTCALPISQGWGRPPTITERSDLRLAAKIGDTGDDWEPKPGARAHARLSWIEREDSFDPKPESSLKWGEKTGNWDDQGYTWEEGL